MTEDHPTLEIPDDLAEEWQEIHEGVEELIPPAEMLAKLRRSRAENRPLRVKLGCDPSAPDLHLGHAVVLNKLRQFQNRGHTVVFIIGDGTGRIGDPSGRSETRPQLTEDEVRRNAETYFQQVFKILDESNTEVEYNSRWFLEMKFEEVIRLMAGATIARLLERDDFHNRHAAGQAIHLHEFMYPLMQGYDSVMVKADIEAGGTDQKFNLLVGRDMQREAGQEPQCIMTMTILPGLDGVQKMSKSLGNTIGLTDPPEEMYGKAMSISDDLMETYLRLTLSYSAEESKNLAEQAQAGQIHPRELKARLARELTERYHSQAAAADAEERFNRVHRDHQRPDSVEELSLALGDTKAIWICKLAVQAGLAKSNAEARRLVRGGGLRINGEAISDEMLELGPGEHQIQAGKRRFLKITLT